MALFSLVVNENDVMQLYKNLSKLIALLSLFFGFIPLVRSQAGDILIFPKRLTFDGVQDRVKILNLHNNGKDTATFKISYIEYKMLNNGGFERIEEPEPGQKFASSHLRFYPRKITLAPDETQVVKVQLVKTNDLEPGEYRSHLYFRAEKPKEAYSTKKGENKEGFNINLIPVYGVSVANIIRVGEPEVQVDIGEYSMEYHMDAPLINITFSREGNMSSYGDISVVHIAPNGKSTLAGEIQGFAIYSPGTIRKTKIELKKEEGINYTQGKLKITYSPQGANKAAYSETVFEL